MDKHTPEPWRHVPHQTENKALVQSYDGRHLAELWTLDKTVDCSANAARIVECVNACSGIAEPAAWVSRARELAISENALREHTLSRLVKLVGDMRAAQARFFANRQNVDLQNSKRLEKEVDMLIKQYEEGLIERTQPSLF